MGMSDAILEHLTVEDDPELWHVALAQILAEVEKRPDVVVEIGCCSHWIRPHCGGGMPRRPAGYDPTTTGYSFKALPQFDWSVSVKWTGESWEPARRKSVKYAVRVAIPARTKQHPQATVHTLWMMGKEKELRFYGFRKQNDVWKCTAVEELVKEDGDE